MLHYENNPFYNLISQPLTLYDICNEYPFEIQPSLYEYAFRYSPFLMDGKYLVLSAEEQDEFFNEDESGLEELI